MEEGSQLQVNRDDREAGGPRLPRGRGGGASYPGLTHHWLETTTQDNGSMHAWLAWPDPSPGSCCRVPGKKCQGGRHAQDTASLCQSCPESPGGCTSLKVKICKAAGSDTWADSELGRARTARPQENSCGSRTTGISPSTPMAGHCDGADLPSAWVTQNKMLPLSELLLLHS